MGWIRDRYGKTHLGGGSAEIFVESRKGRDSPVERFGGGTSLDQIIAKGLHIEDGGFENLLCLLWPANPDERCERHNIFPVSAACMRTSAPIHPGFKNVVD